MQILAEIFEDGWRLRWQRGEIIDRFVSAGGEAGSGHVMAKNSAIDDLCEKARLRNKFAHQVGDIFLTLGSKGFLIARAAAEGDDNDFAVFLKNAGPRKKSWREQSAA